MEECSVVNWCYDLVLVWNRCLVIDDFVLVIIIYLDSYFIGLFGVFILRDFSVKFFFFNNISLVFISYNIIFLLSIYV